MRDKEGRRKEEESAGSRALASHRSLWRSVKIVSCWEDEPRDEEEDDDEGRCGAEEGPTDGMASRRSVEAVVRTMVFPRPGRSRHHHQWPADQRRQLSRRLV